MQNHATSGYRPSLQSTVPVQLECVYANVTITSKALEVGSVHS